MASNPQQQKRRDNALSSLNVAIDALNITKDILSGTPAKAVCGPVSVILTMIKDSMINDTDYVELGLACADICNALGRGMNGKKLDDLSQSVYEAIAQLTITVAEIQRRVTKQSKRNGVSRLFHARNDKEKIAAWKSEINRILHVFNTELSINTHVVVSDIRQDVANTRAIVSNVHQGVVNTHTIISELHHDVETTCAAITDTHTTVTDTYTTVSDTRTMVSDIHRAIVENQDGTDSNSRLTQTSAPGESPPPPPRVCFGRDELVNKIINLAENLTPIALIGPGGIGKTSIALTVLHHNHIKKQFGTNRRFIRCDQFPATCSHFLSRLSKAIGAGVENPEDLTPLRPFLSSGEMIIFLDNAESILDPQGANARDIYGVVEELSRFGNICLCITSRISTIPTTCKTLDIPTLSMEAAHNTFYGIYENGDRQSNQVSNILEQLDFHPLSITLLATVAHHSKWGTSRLTSEWEKQRTDILHTKHDESLAATIELSLGSPMFHKLGPNARELLGVIAFFPQGVNENNLDWLFPTLSNRTTIFDNLCILSLTYQSNGFITMLAPLREYLCPKDPASSPLLCTTKDHYFSRLSVLVNAGQPGFNEARWITSEDVNVEHLLDVFTSADPGSADIWNVCSHFMEHLFWHKQRLVMLGQKIEGLPDDHKSKPQCLFDLSRLFGSVGNFAEHKQLLIHALRLWRKQENNQRVAQTLMFLSYANGKLGLCKEGIQQAREALKIHTSLNDTLGQTRSQRELGRLLFDDRQFDAAEQVALQVVNSLPYGGDKFEVCECHRLLGEICHAKGKTQSAIEHLETAIRIATASNWNNPLFGSHHTLAVLFFDKKEFDNAHTHIECAKSYAIDRPYLMGRAMETRAVFWYQEHKFEEAKCEALCAIDAFKKIGAMRDVENCQAFLEMIKAAPNKPMAPH